jgi:hypothetical protein
MRKKTGCYLSVFKGIKRNFVVLKIQSGGWPLILEQDYVTKNISVWGINISLRVIEDAKKDGLLFIRFQRNQEELFCA